MPRHIESFGYRSSFDLSSETLRCFYSNYRKGSPADGSTRDLGYLIINVATTVAVYEAIDPGVPLSHRICSVVGDVKQKNVYFPLGNFD